MSKKNDREYYEKLFQKYPDIVDTKTFCEMLGGIGITTAWKMIRGNHVKHIYYLGQAYLIPKVWVIDYIMGDHYKDFKKKLKTHV